MHFSHSHLAIVCTEEALRWNTQSVLGGQLSSRHKAMVLPFIIAPLAGRWPKWESVPFLLTSAWVSVGRWVIALAQPFKLNRSEGFAGWLVEITAARLTTSRLCVILEWLATFLVGFIRPWSW